MATAAPTTRFTGVDFYDSDSLLAEEERAVRDTVRLWVDEHLMPIIGECYVAGRFPRELIPGMAELGLFGANLPEEYGCAGLNNVAYGLIMQELERGDSGIRSFASVQGGLVMYPIYTFGSAEQKKHWLPLLAGGQEIGCFGLTEPDFGSAMSPVLAQMIATVACDPFVIHILVPLSTHPSAVSRAVVIKPPGLDPKSGSVSPKQPISCPPASSGSQCFFCSADPKV